MMSAFKKSYQAFFLLIFFITIGCLIFASLLFNAEKGDLNTETNQYVDSDGNPSQFQSIPDTMWCILVTMTTVGYGDMVPVTKAGKVVATLSFVFGIILIALPVAIVGEKFQEVYKEYDEKQKKKEMAAKDKQLQKMLK
jgi:hypothetical protein